MTKKQIRQLVTASYKNEQLDEEFISQLMSRLSRKDIKMYVGELKNFEQKNSIAIISASPLSEKEMQKVISLYPNKKVYVTIDSSLMLGVRIIDNDNVYSTNLQETLIRMVEHVSQV